MAQQETNQVNATTNTQVETPAVQNVEQQNAAPAENGVPADQQAAPVKEEKKHPKLDAFVAKAKKVGKVVGVGVVAVGGFIVANKLGKGAGYKAGVADANEAFAEGVKSVTPDPEPAELPGPTTDGFDTSATEVVDVVDVDQV